MLLKKIVQVYLRQLRKLYDTAKSHRDEYYDILSKWLKRFFINPVIIILAIIGLICLYDTYLNNSFIEKNIFTLEFIGIFYVCIVSLTCIVAWFVDLRSLVLKYSESQASPTSVVEANNLTTKRLEAIDDLNNRKSRLLFQNLLKAGYTEVMGNNHYKWVRSTDEYAYFVYKFYRVFTNSAKRDSQIEFKFISELIRIPDNTNPNTVRRYVNQYDARQKRKPASYSEIDSLILSAYSS